MNGKGEYEGAFWHAAPGNMNERIVHTVVYKSKYVRGTYGMVCILYCTVLCTLRYDVQLQAGIFY